MKMPGRIAVVISGWTGHLPNHLAALCKSIAKYEAGSDFDIVLCVNGLEYRLPTKLAGTFTEVFIRENIGFNLGAWDHAWRSLPQHDRFLFLQDECSVARKHWLRDFIHRYETMPDCGLVGEYLNRDWDRPCGYLADPANGFRYSAAAGDFRKTFARWGLPEGETALHITTVVQYTTRKILEEVTGYHIGSTKNEAVAAEIAFSRKIAALGYCLTQVGHHRHSRISHPQWLSTHPLAKIKRSISKRRGRV
jgi:hypothetical protein